MHTPRIIIVEDHNIVARDLRSTLVHLGYDVPAIAASGEEAIMKTEELHPDLVLMDIVLQGNIDGVEAAREIRDRFDVPVIYLTAYADKTTIERAKRTEPLGYIIKPFEDREVHTTIEMALYKHEMEHRLRESERKLSTILQSVDNAIIATNTEGKITFMNSIAEHLTGWLAGNAVGKSLADVLHLQKSGRSMLIRNQIDALIEACSVLDFSNDIHLVSKTGRVTPVDCGISVIEDDGEVHNGYVIALRDIGERKRAEKELKASEARYAELYHSSPDMYATIAAGTAKVVRSNQTLARSLGCTPEELHNRSFFELFDEQSIPLAKEVFQRFLTSGEVKNADLHLRRSDGSSIAVSLSMVAVRGSDGTIQYGRCSWRDITEERRTREALRLSEERFRALIENSTDAIAVIDQDGMIQYASSSTRHVLGYSPEELSGRNVLEFLHPREAVMLRAILREFAKSIGSSMRSENQLRRSDGSWRWIESTAKNLLAVPSVQGVVVNYRDITERREADEEIRRLNTELEERVHQRTEQLTAANRELEAFSYSISHDLRAPLRAINGFAGALMEDYAGKLDPQAENYLGIIQINTRAMSQLIDDLLAFSRLGRKELVKSSVYMTELARSVVIELSRNETDRTVDVDIQDLPSVYGDSSLLRQVYVNLISNALKFTRYRLDTKIVIGAQRDGQNTIYFVEDNGVGFDMNYQNKLFGVFQRLHPADEFEGTGVGLAIVQRIIRRHGGRVWAKGTVGQGATFYFSLPRD